MDITDLNKINQIYHSEILACLNPDGIAEPQSLTPLILKYHFKQFTTIEVSKYDLFQYRFLKGAYYYF